MCACETIGAPSMSRLIRRAGGLGEDVADIRFEVGVKCSVAEAEMVLFRMLNKFTGKAARAEVLATAGMKEIMRVKRTLIICAQ